VIHERVLSAFRPSKEVGAQIARYDFVCTRKLGGQRHGQTHGPGTGAAVMNPDTIKYIMWIAVSVNLAACAINVASMIRSVCNYRLARICRLQTLAYEKELRERGVTLPARCVACSQVLPAHVGGCLMEAFYKEHGWPMEWLTRSPIEYPSGNKPAEWCD
jgi:hypothetical protein